MQHGFNDILDLPPVGPGVHPDGAAHAAGDAGAELHPRERFAHRQAHQFGQRAAGPPASRRTPSFPSSRRLRPRRRASETRAPRYPPSRTIRLVQLPTGRKGDPPCSGENRQIREVSPSSSGKSKGVDSARRRRSRYGVRPVRRRGSLRTSASGAPRGRSHLHDHSVFSLPCIRFQKCLSHLPDASRPLGQDDVGRLRDLQRDVSQWRQNSEIWTASGWPARRIASQRISAVTPGIGSSLAA